MMRNIDVNDAIDNNPFGKFQWSVVVLCALLLIVDGYDVFVAGTVLPTLIAEWGLTKPQAGTLQAWALFGMMFGALIFGPLADKIGRKKGIAISFMLFTTATFLTGFAGSPDQFKVFRFIAGFGCGGMLLAQQLPLQQNFLLFAIPAAISALAMLVFAVSNARSASPVQLAAA